MDKVFEDLKHEDFQAMLNDMVTEAEALVTSGDLAISNLGRKFGIIASALIYYTNMTKDKVEELVEHFNTGTVQETNTGTVQKTNAENFQQFNTEHQNG